MDRRVTIAPKGHDEPERRRGRRAVARTTARSRRSASRQKHAQALAAYLDTLAAWSARVNLTGARTPPERVAAARRPGPPRRCPLVRPGLLVDVGLGQRLAGARPRPRPAATSGQCSSSRARSGGRSCARRPRGGRRVAGRSGSDPPRRVRRRAGRDGDAARPRAAPAVPRPAGPRRGTGPRLRRPPRAGRGVRGRRTASRVSRRSTCSAARPDVPRGTRAAPAAGSTGNLTVKQRGPTMAAWAKRRAYRESSTRGSSSGVLVGEGHFGGDGRQPHVTLRMHVRHERLFRWIEERFPGGRLYGPYHHGGRDYYQWMARGEYLRETLLPLLLARREWMDDAVRAPLRRHVRALRRRTALGRAAAGAAVTDPGVMLCCPLSARGERRTSGTHHRDRQPEGRGRQDHDGGQPRREPRRRRAAGSRRGRRPPGQPHLRPRPQDPREPAEPLRGAHRAAAARGADGADRPRAPDARALRPQPDRGRGRARERHGPRVPAEGGARARRRRSTTTSSSTARRASASSP